MNLDSSMNYIPKPARKFIPTVLSLFVGVGYGLATLFLFHNVKNRSGAAQPWWVIMSFGFVFFLPFVVGFASVYLASENIAASKWKRIFYPWINVLLCLGAALALGYEGMICVVMALPIYLILASIGGIVGGIAKIDHMKKPAAVLAVLFLTPYLSGPIENQFPTHQQLRRVDTEITIAAPAERVWQNIIRVPAIHDLPTSPVFQMGFPKPIEATLSHEGVGGVRNAKFERGLEFVETVTDWQDKKLLSFKIKADPNSIPPTALDEHVTIGGPYFDMLSGTYEIEEQNGLVILHLWSEYKLATRFNFYSGIWSDFVLSEIQNNILKVIQKRCESSVAQKF